MNGRGTKQDPYKIETFKQLQYISQELDACYELVSDIDATNTNKQEFTSIGERKKPFTGTFDGNDHQIANLRIKQPDRDIVGLFDSIGEEGEVRNLRLTNASIQGKKYVGGLVVDNYGRMESCCIQGGSLSGDKTVGGLVARNHGKVESSYTVKVDVSGDYGVGGLVGLNNSDGKVELSYVLKVDVSGQKLVGGLVSYNLGVLESSYTVDNNISGYKDTGSCVGCNDYGNVSESCFTMSSSNERNIPEEPDLIISRRDHRILYNVESSTLLAEVNGELYSREEVSPIQIDTILDERTVVKMTDRFRVSVVGMI